MATLDQLLREYTAYPRAWQERGHIHKAQGDDASALHAYAKAVELNPALTASWRSLAEIHGRGGAPERARQARERLGWLERLPPQLRQVTDLTHEQQLHQAEQLCRRFLKRNKDHIEAMRLLAEIGVRLKIYDDAEFLLESCVEFAPNHLQARIDYANLLIRKTKFEQARAQAEWLLATQPDNANFKTILATTLVGLGCFDEGIALYREVLARLSNQPPATDADASPEPGTTDGNLDAPSSSTATASGAYRARCGELHLLIGHAQKTIGSLDEAIESYRQAYRLRPDYGDAFWSLANIKTYHFTAAEIEHIGCREQAPSIAKNDRIHLCFAAGKAHEDGGQYDDSFAYYQRGNALKLAQSGYRPEINESRVQAQLRFCTADLFERRQGLGYQCQDPIFIVGLPRAGSTLLEQILASHSQVDGTMELHNILALAQRLRGRQAEKQSRYPRILHELDDDYWHRFGARYIEQTRAYRGSAPFFVDKMPNNFMHIGLIRLILPQAKIIDARRHPMACCFGCFKQLFGEGQEFTYGLTEVGRYYRSYVRLMEHWDEVLPGSVLRVQHEDLVDDLDGQVRRMLDFCGLPFEESCLHFHRTERNIRTPSAEQVRQPIYRDGLEQWRHFERHLAPLRESLGADLLTSQP